MASETVLDVLISPPPEPAISKLYDCNIDMKNGSELATSIAECIAVYPIPTAVAKSSPPTDNAPKFLVA